MANLSPKTNLAVNALSLMLGVGGGGLDAFLGQKSQEEDRKLKYKMWLTENQREDASALENKRRWDTEHREQKPLNNISAISSLVNLSKSMNQAKPTDYLSFLAGAR